MITIIYYTENRLSEPLFTQCQELLKKAANERPIISVSHKPIELGTNICIGEQKPCWLTLYKQILLGARLADTKYIAMAEHDCVYTDEHFSFVPPRDDTFFYNENVCLVQWAKNSHPELNGMYSRYWTQRLALSQLICNREIFIESTKAKLDVLEGEDIKYKHIANAGEPGVTNITEANKWAKSGRAVYLKKYLKDQLDKEKYDTFKTKIPNLDIRHDSNFTGPKRGIKRTYGIKHWGEFKNIINGFAPVPERQQ